MPSFPHPRPLRTVAVATSLLVGLALAPIAVSGGSAVADDERRAPASTVGEKLLTVAFSNQDSTIDPGADFNVRGTISKVTQDDVLGEVGLGVPGRFTLQVVDADGAVLATQEVTAGVDGGFSTMVPGSVTEDLAVGAEGVRLAVRAVDATLAGGFASADAGATEVVVRGKATGLRLANSFVSSVGWVKPGERYPSRILVSNPTRSTITGARVVVRAPKGSVFRTSSGPGRARLQAKTVTWKVPAVKPKQTTTLVVVSQASTLKQLPTIVWRDLSTKATLKGKAGRGTATSRGPKVIPPSGAFDSARYGDRPFPVVPVQYLDRPYVSGHSGGDLDAVINSPKLKGSTFNLFQEMSLDQLFPNGTVPSADLATADFDYAPGFEFQETDPRVANTCTGVTFGDSPVPVQGTPIYSERISNGVYNLPGQTQWYGADANGSAVVGSQTPIAALANIDSGCGPLGKIVADAAALSDPEIDYSDFDTDKDGVVDFFMVVFAGCGGNGASQAPQVFCGSTAPSDQVPYDNIWPHSSSLEGQITDPASGLTGFITDDQLKDLEGRKLYYTNAQRQAMTTKKTQFKVFVRVGPYNLNPETAIDKASVISHEYGHSLGLPDFYSGSGRETYGDWNLMATDKSQNMDAFARQELGWVVPEVLTRGTRTVRRITDSKQDTRRITWRTPSGKPYTLKNGRDGRVHNARMFMAKLPGRTLLSPKMFETGVGASKSHAWFGGRGNMYGCATDGGGHNLDFSLPQLAKVSAGTPVTLSFKSNFDIEWDYDYGFVLTSEDGGETFTSNPSEEGYTTSNLDPLAGNPNQNGCQGAYDNGITGTSGSYADGTEAVDRKVPNYPPGVFVNDSYDISELAGAKTPVLRFSYSTDPFTSRPGWFIDDLVVKAGNKVIYRSDFEKSGSPSDPFVFNGGCKPDSPGRGCTAGWQYVKAGAEVDFDHAYYLEMRDRSGFDLQGNDQIDRAPIAFQPGFYLSYTDEAHGYGNNGTDDPPAQSPLDANPQPGNATPNLNDAAFRATKGRDAFSDFGKGHVDNYENPAESRAAGDVANPWRFAYDCLSFRVLDLKGDGVGPQRADGDLTGTVRFRIGKGCAGFDYGYTKAGKGGGTGGKNTAPQARITSSRVVVPTGAIVRFDGSGSTDRQTPRHLDHVWSWDDGSSDKDAGGALVQHAFTEPGTYRVRLLVTDPQGRTSVDQVTITVT